MAGSREIYEMSVDEPVLGGFESNSYGMPPSLYGKLSVDPRPKAPESFLLKYAHMSSLFGRIDCQSRRRVTVIPIHPAYLEL